MVGDKYVLPSIKSSRVCARFSIGRRQFFSFSVDAATVVMVVVAGRAAIRAVCSILISKPARSSAIVARYARSLSELTVPMTAVG